MSLVRRLTTYVHDVVDTVQDVLALDDPLLCDCVDGWRCADCSQLPSTGVPVPGWTAPLDAA